MNTDCEICSKLKEVETSFYKYGAPEYDRSLPLEASKLQPAQYFDPADSRQRYVKKCPICGEFYLYELDYEYLVNGTEDTETLTRLAHSQARELIGDIDLK